MHKQQRGFTLIELLVVATIIIVISAIGLVSFTNTGRSARDSKRRADLETVRQALVLYRSEEGSYPVGQFDAVVSLLATEDYISNPTPVDPKNEAPYRYELRSDATGFCLCAQLESPGSGNATSNATSTSCTFGSGNFYCVENP